MVARRRKSGKTYTAVYSVPLYFAYNNVVLCKNFDERGPTNLLSWVTKETKKRKENVYLFEASLGSTKDTERLC